MNIFDKLEQDISNQIQSLQAKQQELIEKKKYLATTKEKIQNFLTSAQEIQQIVRGEPELLKSIQKELGKIFSSHNNPQPKLPIKKENSTTPNLESPPENKPIDSALKSADNSDDTEEGEAIKIFNFVDAQGKNTSF